jgi:hypothetical protein
MLWHALSQCDLLFTTLRNSEALFSPSTRYRDLALDQASSTGKARAPPLLERKQGAITEPFVCLGFATYESHEGERPMAIPDERCARSRRRRAHPRSDAQSKPPGDHGVAGGSGVKAPYWPSSCPLAS